MKTLLALLVVSVSVVPLAAADLTGTWVLRLDPDFSGHQMSVTCTFKQDAQKLTIKCGDGAPFSGDVTGQKVTWQFKTGPDQALTATQTGELDSRGTTITGVWHLNRDKDTDGKFTAIKQ
jgi:hypothetical protein